MAVFACGERSEPVEQLRHATVVLDDRGDRAAVDGQLRSLPQRREAGHPGAWRQREREVPLERAALRGVEEQLELGERERLVEHGADVQRLQRQRGPVGGGRPPSGTGRTADGWIGL